MIRYEYIHEFDDEIEQYERMKSDIAFFNEQFDALSYYDRQMRDAVLFNEGALEQELIMEGVKDAFSSIGEKIIKIINRVKKFISDTFQKFKTAAWEKKDDAKKLKMLSKKDPELAKRATIAVKEGNLKLNDFKDLSTFYKEIDSVLDQIEKGDVDPNSLKGKINSAKEKFDSGAKTLAVVAGVAGSVLTIYKFAQLFKNKSNENNRTLEQMRDAAEVQANKMQRMASAIHTAPADDREFQALRRKASVLSYATAQYEQVTNGAISRRTKMKYALNKTLDSAISIFGKVNNTVHSDAVDSALGDIKTERQRNMRNIKDYQNSIDKRRRGQNNRTQRH